MKKHFVSLLVIFLFSLIGLKALFYPGLYTAHDIWHQVSRLYWYQQAFLDGQFPPYWIGQLANGIGYPLFIFSYHLPWLSALPLLSLGLEIPQVIKILFFACYLFSGFGVYALGYSIFKQRTTALLIAILYLWAPNRFSTVFVSAQMGVAFVYLFLPIFLLGLWQSSKLKKSYQSLILTSVGLSGLILSHLSSLLSLFPLSLFFSLLAFAKSENKRRTLITVFLGSLLGLGICSFYLLPAIYYSGLIQGLGDFYQKFFVNFRQLVYSPWGYGIVNSSAKEGAISFQVGIAQWLIVMASIFLITFKRKDIKVKKYLGLALVLLLSFFISLFFMLDPSRPFWTFMAKYISLDFPTRFLTPAVFSASLLAGFVLWPFRREVRKTFLAILLLVALYSNRNHLRVNLYHNPPLKETISGEVTTTSYHEYFPKTADTSLIYEEVALIEPKDEIRVNKVTRTTDELFFEYHPNDPVDITLGVISFPGLKLFIDGMPTVYQTDNLGKISFYSSPGRHTLQLKYEGTALIKTSKLISLAGILILTGVILSKIFYKKPLTDSFG